MANWHTFRLSNGEARPDIVQAFNAILDFNSPVVCSWGIDPDKKILLCTTFEKMEDVNGKEFEAQNTALYFFVNGFKYTGRVLFLYNEALDTFEIYKAKTIEKNHTLHAELIHEDVYLSDARRLLDEMIETGGNAEEYQQNIKHQKETDPLYNFLGGFMSDDEQKKVYVSTQNEAGGVSSYSFEKVSDGERQGVKIEEHDETKH